MDFIQANIFPTTSCNIGCRHCGVDKSKAETMQDEVLEKLLEDLSKMTVEQVTITGGEPLQEEHSDRLIDFLRNSRVGKEKKVDIFTNALWAGSYQEAETMIEKLASAGVSELTLSTDEFHREFVPLEYIANALNAAQGKVKASVAVRSFRSTEKRDTKAIYRLAELMGKEVTGVTYHPLDANEAMMRILKEIGGKKSWLSRLPFFGKRKDSLRNCSGIIYRIGDPEDEPVFDNLVGSDKTIGVAQEWGSLAGDAKNYLGKRDLFLKIYKHPAEKETFDQLKEGMGCSMKAGRLFVMPDGSMLPCCDWNMLNNYRETALAKYPETSIASFQEILESHPLSCVYSGKWDEVQEFMEEHRHQLDDKELFISHSKYNKRDYLGWCSLCVELHKAVSELVSTS